MEKTKSELRFQTYVQFKPTNLHSFPMKINNIDPETILKSIRGTETAYRTFCRPELTIEGRELEGKPEGHSGWTWINPKELTIGDVYNWRRREGAVEKIDNANLIRREKVLKEMRGGARVILDNHGNLEVLEPNDEIVHVPKVKIGIRA